VLKRNFWLEPACGCALAAACWLCPGRCTSEVPPSLGLAASVACGLTDVSLCKGVVPFRGGGSALHSPACNPSSISRPPRPVPCMHLSGQSSGRGARRHFVVVQAAPSAKISALPIEPHALVVALCLRLAVSISRGARGGRCSSFPPPFYFIQAMPVLPIACVWF
jgi:hypothetical protein